VLQTVIQLVVSGSGTRPGYSGHSARSKLTPVLIQSKISSLSPVVLELVLSVCWWRTQARTSPCETIRSRFNTKLYSNQIELSQLGTQAHACARYYNYYIERTIWLGHKVSYSVYPFLCREDTCLERTTWLCPQGVLSSQVLLYETTLGLQRRTS
jgi:hypothetical protein